MSIKLYQRKLIQDTITNVAGELLKEINIFDVYQGKGYH